MRIAAWHNLPSGGAKRLLAAQVAGLVARGHLVEVWSPNTADVDYLPLPVPEHILPLPTRGSVERRIDEHCKHVVEQQGAHFDVLLATNCRMTTVPPIGQRSPLPSVLYLHEPRRRIYEAAPLPAWLEQGPRWGSAGVSSLLPSVLRDTRRVRRTQRFSRAEIANVQRYGRVLVNSLYSRESVLRAYGIDTSVCYPGVDTDFFSPDGGTRDAFLLGVGHLAPHKNVALVIAAVGLLTPPRPALVWVANAVAHPYRKQMEALASSLDVRLEVHVGVKDEALRELYRRAALLIYAPRLEPFGLVPLEAAACGLPVVGILEGGLRETLLNGVTGRLCEATPHAVAEATAELLHDDDVRASLGASARRHVAEHWGVERSVASLEDHLLAQARRAA